MSNPKITVSSVESLQENKLTSKSRLSGTQTGRSHKSKEKGLTHTNDAKLTYKKQNFDDKSWLDD